MSITITDVKVSQMQGNRLVVATSPTADVERAEHDTGVILTLPVTTQNGGPMSGLLPLYRITGTTADGGTFNESSFRYVGLTPAGNYQFTTQL